MISIRDSGQKEYWSHRAETYGKQYGLDTETTQIKIQRKVELMRPYLEGKNIIELGCGTGLFTKELFRANPNLISTDISTDMIAVAQRANPSVPFLEMDARKLVLRSDYYDVVVSMYLLQHVDTKLVLPEIHRVLRQGGRMVAIVPNILNPIHYARARVGIFRKMIHETSESESFTRWQWEKMLARYFRDWGVKPIEFTSPFTPRSLLSTMMKWNEKLESIPVLKEFAGTLLIVARK